MISGKVAQKSMNYDIKNEQGRRNIEIALYGYHEKLNDVYPVDVVISGIAGFGAAMAMFCGGPFTWGFLSIAAFDGYLVGGVRNPRETIYQEHLELLVKISENCLKYGASVTSDPLFLKLMSILLPCLSTDKVSEIFFPAKFNTAEEYPLLSKDYKTLLASPPHNIMLIAPPTPKIEPKPKEQPGIIQRFFGKSQDVKQIEPVPVVPVMVEEPVKPETKSSWSGYTNTAWCMLYGYKPKSNQPGTFATLKNTLSDAVATAQTAASLQKSFKSS
jgi:hypothetical protein